MHKEDESKRKLVKARHNLQLLILLLFVPLKKSLFLKLLSPWDSCQWWRSSSLSLPQKCDKFLLQETTICTYWQQSKNSSAAEYQITQQVIYLLCVGEHPSIFAWHNGKIGQETSNAEADSRRNICCLTCNARSLMKMQEVCSSISVLYY
jgi:hypothetical protein